MSILRKILNTKYQEIAKAKSSVSLKTLKEKAEQIPKTRDFVAALSANIAAKKPAIIAEIKKASPSKGLIRADFNALQLAYAYQAGGACCLSVLTDKEYFQGADVYLSTIKQGCYLPLLRKDFIIDSYQVYQSAVLGADCILLIIAVFDDDILLKELVELATSLGLAVLAEVHNRLELARALALGLPMIGINNRNLKTFTTSLQTTINLLPDIPDGMIIISESAIFNRQDIIKLQNYGVHSFLVGESLMRQNDVKLALEKLMGANDECKN